MYSSSKVLVFSVIFVLLTVEKCFGAECPPAEDIYPCRCEHGDGNRIECNNLTTTDQFAEILQRSRHHGIYSIRVERSIMEYIPKEAFQVDEMVSVRIAYNVLDLLFDELPRNSAVRFLVIKKNQLKEGWDWRSLSTLTQLEFLTLYLTPTDGTLDSKYISKKLKYLYTYRCRVKYLQDNVFQNFVKLEQLHINRESISILKRSMFPRPAKLHTISFTGTQISTLPDDLFEDMPYLKHIDLSKNQLTFLSENTFKPVLRAWLSLFGNFLTCDCGMKWILNSRDNVSGECSSPNDLYDRELSSLSEEDFEYC